MPLANLLEDIYAQPLPEFQHTLAYVVLEVFQRRNDLTFLASVTLFLRPLNPGFVPAGVVSGKESAARRNSFYQCGWLPIR
jgi:hypothetical protein